MDKKTRYKPAQLYESILTICEIGSCDKCGDRDNIMNVDDYDACEYFFKEGWRITPNKLYCPKCANKYLKLSTPIS